jgi:hypothetical protein
VSIPNTTPDAFKGVRMILRYNWPLYLGGIGVALTGAALAAARQRHRLLRAAGSATALAAGWLAAASLVASWWVLHRSELYHRTWLQRVGKRRSE